MQVTSCKHKGSVESTNDTIHGSILHTSQADQQMREYGLAASTSAARWNSNALLRVPLERPLRWPLVEYVWLLDEVVLRVFDEVVLQVSMLCRLLVCSEPRVLLCCPEVRTLRC